MSIKDNLLASIIIVNFNNAKYINQCINSIKKQNYKQKEIIFVDDKSKDNSVQLMSKFKNIKYIKTKSKTKYGSYNQMNAYYEGFLASKGDIIFFLDSDDFFVKNKLKKIINIFVKNKKTKIIFDHPIYIRGQKKIKKKINQKFFLLSSWPRFTPQSCISMRRKYFYDLFKISFIKKFPDVWFDFRIAIYFFLKFKKIEIIGDYLTYYRISNNSASSKFKTYSKKWWQRRDQAHSYFSYVSKKLKIKDRVTLDKIVTKLFNSLL